MPFSCVSAVVGIITPVGFSQSHYAHCPLISLHLTGAYLAPWKLRVPILPSGLFAFSLLADAAAMLSKAKSPNGSFRSRKVLNPGFPCCGSVGQREAGADPKGQVTTCSSAALSHHWTINSTHVPPPPPHLSLYVQFLQNLAVPSCEMLSRTPPSTPCPHHTQIPSSLRGGALCYLRHNNALS